jgi:dinuclear metal center YbgI/SA1388 family protein
LWFHIRNSFFPDYNIAQGGIQLKLAEIIREMERTAPPELAEEGDNIGLLLGDGEQEVRKVLVALDVTDAVVKDAATEGCDLIIAHHPMIYMPLKSLDFASPTPRKIRDLIKHDISVYCAHTNLDKARGGVSDCLVAALGLEGSISPLIPEGDGVGIGRVVELPGRRSLFGLAEQAQKALNLPHIRYTGEPDKIVRKIAVCGGDGTGSRYVSAAISQGCDAYLTGDLRYHVAEDALAAGLGMVDLTHYASELPVLAYLRERLTTAFPSLHISVAKSAPPF